MSEAARLFDTVSAGRAPRGERCRSLAPWAGEDGPEGEGLYYFNARWYDPGTGRFLSEDPVMDGTLWYAYVGNNPMTYTDPTGMMPAPAYTAAKAAPGLPNFISPDRPMSQYAFDKRYGFGTGKDPTWSCPSLALIHAYAATTPGGVPLKVLDAVVKTWKEEKSIRTEGEFPGSPANAENMSMALAKALGRSTYLNLDYSGPGRTEKSFATEAEFRASGAEIGIAQLYDAKRRATHYVLMTEEGRVDSLSPTRPNAEGYEVRAVYPLQELTLPTPPAGGSYLGAADPLWLTP